jgi:hypothetical protein
METLKPSFLFTKWCYHNRKIETWSFFLYSSIPKYKPYSFKENSKISRIALHHLSGILFWDLISFPYLIQTTLFSHITWPWVIPPKPGVLFPPGAFFNFCAKNYIWLIFRNTWSTLYIWNSPNSFYLRHIFQMLIKINFKDVDQCGRFNGTSGQSSRTYLDQVLVQDVKDEPDLTEQIWSCIGGRCQRTLLLSASHLLSDTTWIGQCMKWKENR